MEDKSEVIISASTDEKVAEMVKKFNASYVHWDELRYKDTAGVDPEVIWALMKMSRRNSAKKIRFKEWTFQYNITDNALRIMHILDSSAGGTLEVPVPGLKATQKTDRYVVSSLMEEAIASSQIEGAVTTTKVAKEMLKTQRNPRNVSEQMIINSYVVMKRLKEIKSEKLTIELIKELHRLITYKTLKDPAYEGKFRDDDQTVVRDPLEIEKVYHVPPDYRKIESYLQELCDFANNDEKDFIHPLIKGITIHFMIGYIHPFVDGNGRLARTLFYWYALRNNYWLFEKMAISKTIKESKGRYGMAYLYTESDDNDLTYFIDYNLRCMEKALKNVTEYIQRKQQEQRDAFKLATSLPDVSSRQAEILKYTIKSGRPVSIKEISTMFDVVYETARTDLLDLAKKGHLDVSRDKKKMLFIAHLDSQNHPDSG